MINSPLPRIDLDKELHDMFLPFCRLRKDETWSDPDGKHFIACLDSTDKNKIEELFCNDKADLALQDPPYNFVAFEEKSTNEFINWCRRWVNLSDSILKEDASLYIWLGADQNNHFQPLADFIIMMKETSFNSRSFITMRNQRGYGTQKNWMAVRQELLYYIKGNPLFQIEAEYTDIPKVLNGYYKDVNGKKTLNLERGKSPFIRAGNVWVDIQQVFYRMEENVNGCFAQKPLKAIQRIILASTKENDLVTDFFSHSGTTLLASEILNRRCITADIDPIFCEISIRRLERYRKTGKTGWQNSNPFEREIFENQNIKDYLSLNYTIKNETKPVEI